MAHAAWLPSMMYGSQAHGAWRMVAKRMAHDAWLPSARRTMYGCQAHGAWRMVAKRTAHDVWCMA
eukprot:365323-Chlamydomonas_euryale.AAC.11